MSDETWPDHYMVLNIFTLHGYEARKVLSATTGEPVWRVATPSRTLLRATYATVEDAEAAINEHRGLFS